MSSMLQTSSVIWPLDSSRVLPQKLRTQLAWPKSLVPMPTPICSTVITGMGPKLDAKWASSAAPVGVHSSPIMLPP